MAFQAVTEVSVHISSFRNVDLFHQGLYHLRCRIFQERGNQIVEAVPHLLREAGRNGDRNAAERPNAGLLPSAVLEDELSFRTQSFLIRYCEEVVDIEDNWQFRIEQDAEEDLPMIIEMKLMFADITPHGGADRFDPEVTAALPPKVPEGEFSAVSTQRMRLYGTLHGFHQHCPIVFDEFHFCQANLMVHASLLDFRLRLKPKASLAREMLSQPRVIQSMSLTETLLSLGRIIDRKNAEGSATEGGSNGVDSAAHAVKVEGDNGADEQELLARAADSLQTEYAGRLAMAHADIAQFLKRVSDRREPSKRLAWMKVKDIAYPGGSNSGTNAKSASLSARLISGSNGVTAPAAARLLAEDLSFMSAQVLEVWQVLLKSLPPCSNDIGSLLRASWCQQAAAVWTLSIFHETCSIEDLTVPSDRKIWSTHEEIAKQIRQSPNQSHEAQTRCSIEDVSMSIDHAAHPILFEQRYEATSSVAAGPPSGETTSEAGVGHKKQPGPGQRLGPTAQPYKGVHVFVLVHGFQGNSFDMRLMKNNIALLYPKALYLCSSSNEEDTEGDLQQMGENLADEVRRFVRDWCPGRPQSTLDRLSFIAHSVGGLIVRSALPLLQEFHSKLRTFVSFSTPHLGYMYASNTLFKTGLWVVKKWRGSKCLEQLSLTDAEDPNDSFLNRLANTPGLEHFEYVALVSSYQDQYAPFESARVEISSSAEGDARLGPVYIKMAQSILKPLEVGRVIRFDVNFHIPETNLDTMIGRAAHIQFLECQPLMKMFVHTYGWLLE